MLLCVRLQLFHVSEEKANKSWRQAQCRHAQLESCVTAVLQGKGDEREQLGKEQAKTL